MRFGISTTFMWSRPGNLADYLPYFKRAGFNSLEIGITKNHFFPMNSPEFISELTHMLRNLEMRIQSFHAPFDASIYDPEPKARNYGVREIIRSMERMSPLLEFAPEKPCMVIHPGTHSHKIPGEQQSQSSIQSLKEILDNPLSSRYHICIENTLSSHFGSTAEELLKMVHAVGEGRIFICLDTNHAVYDSCPEDFIRMAGEHILTTHLSDNFHQPYGEFHAPPLTIKHSKIDWKWVLKHLPSHARLLLEPDCPPGMDVDLFVEIAFTSARQLERLF